MSINIYRNGDICGYFDSINDVKKHAKKFGVSSIDINENKRNAKIKGSVKVNFNDNSSTIVHFQCLSDLYNFVARWRSVFGCLLFIDGEPKGILNIGNYYIEERRKAVKNA